MDRIRVGEFDLYPSERMVSAAGKPVELGARAFDLLLVLAENAGRLVNKSTLLERVWPRVIVDENNLPAQIAALRRALGADAIRTVPGFGYRLELPVSRTRSADSAEVPTPASEERRSSGISLPRRTWTNRLKPLIGRDEELRAVQNALADSALVTIVGIAGVGKTRLAQEVLAREGEKPDAAVAWVSLGSTQQAQHIPSAIALALGLSLPDGVDAFVVLCEALETVSVLLILDCAEHVRDALAALITTLVSRTQAVRVLVTSQAPLGIAGEVVYRLPVLPVPAGDAWQAESAQCPAVALFVQRASAADRRFELTSANYATVGEICRHLDGIPLALELAAARVPALGLVGLLGRLDDRFRLLKVAGQAHDPRHNALHTAFDWSYGLLSPAEQEVFDRLGTFAGPFSLPAAAHCVANEGMDPSEAIDLIGRLVDRSLVTVLEVDPPRYTLPETARQYALERLGEKQELGAAMARMASTMLGVLDLAYQEYWSIDEAIWLQRYEPELDNVRAAIDWAVGNDAALGVALFGSAWPLLVETDLYAEGRTRYAQVLTLLSDTLPRERVGRFWEAIAAYDSARQCDRARYAAELAAAMHAAASDSRSQYFALMQFAFNWRVDTAAARSAFDAARLLEDPDWPPRLLTYGALTEGALLTSTGQFVEAREAYQRAVRLALKTSERQALAATVSIVELDIACGDTEAALQLSRPMTLSLRLRRLGRLETRLELLVLSFSALLLSGQLEEARARGAELYVLALRLDATKLYTALDAMAFLACEEGRYDAAARIEVCADAAHGAHGQEHRRPAEERMRAAVKGKLEQALGRTWSSTAKECREQLDEVKACSLALGLTV